MLKVKPNTLHIELQEAEHSTTSGIIVDRNDDKYVSHGKLVQDASLKFDNVEVNIPAGTQIIYSKDKHIPISENEAVVEAHNLIGWEE